MVGEETSSASTNAPTFAQPSAYQHTDLLVIVVYMRYNWSCRLISHTAGGANNG